MRDASRGEPFDVVLLDCDSTLTSLEGIDELARRAGRHAELAELTRQAMDGETRLEDVYGRRLDLVRPSRADVTWLGRRYVETIVEGARETVRALRGAGKEVHVISGGLRPAVETLAAELGLGAERVHAVAVRFTSEGAYAGHDEGSPLARSGGKAACCGRVLGGRRGAIVGDGVTDAEAAPPCDLFVGFGGVAARPSVRGRAGAWVEGPSLAGALEHLLTPRERAQRAGGST